MNRYSVHRYDVVRVKIANIEAESPEQAIEKARQLYDPNEIFDQAWHSKAVEEIEYAGTTEGYLVDLLDGNGFAIGWSYFEDQDLIARTNI